MIPDDVDRFFDELCDLGPEERAVWMKAHSLTPAAKAKLEDLLRRYDSMLDEPEAMPASDGVREEVERAHGDRWNEPPRVLGPYRILDVLGAGGMGVVYRAEQRDPQRSVAIKVLRSGLLIEEAVRRFEREAELLARLQHRGIAQVFELRREDRATYLVMELIDGERLTAYAKERALSRDERLGLIIDLADAVHHAHLRGVIHRDLKPGNVLVTKEGQVKVIDFGVARALDSERHVTLATNLGQVIGTLGYMSPEQVQGASEDIDARADVYALGVLAYELLGGQLPHDLDSKSLPEAARILLEVDAAPLGHVAPQCRGDIEWIVAKALEKEPNRRYPSAAAFGTDIRRMLNHEPVEARPASTLYQLRKLARRNRTLVGGVVATLLAIFAGTAIAVTQALENKDLASQEKIARGKAENHAQDAEQARQAEVQRAEELQKVVSYQEGLLFSIDARRMGLGIRDDLLAELKEESGRSGIDASADDRVRQAEGLLRHIDLVDVAAKTLRRHLLDPARREIHSQFADQPLVRARLLRALARAQVKAGFRTEAVTTHRELIRILVEELGETHQRSLRAQLELAGALNSVGKHEESFELYWELEEMVLDVEGLESPVTVDLLLGLAACLSIYGDHESAEEQYARALEACELVYGPGAPRALTIRSSYARALLAADEPEEAEEHLRSLVEETQSMRIQGHPPSIRLLGDLGGALINQGRFMEAESIAKEAAERMRDRLGSLHPETVDMLFRYAHCLISMRRYADAEPIQRDVVQGLKSHRSAERDRLSRALLDLARVFVGQDRHAEAVAPAVEALALAETLELDERDSVRESGEVLIGVYEALAGRDPQGGWGAKAEALRRRFDGG